MGVETLIKGAKNNDVKLILKAGKFETLNEAILKFQQNDSDTLPAMNMLYSQQDKTKFKNARNVVKNNNDQRRSNYYQGPKPWNNCNQHNKPCNNYRQHFRGNNQHARYNQQGNGQNSRYLQQVNNQYPRFYQQQGRRSNMFMANEQPQHASQSQQNYSHQQYQQHLINSNPTQIVTQIPQNGTNHFLGAHQGQLTQ